MNTDEQNIENIRVMMRRQLEAWIPDNNNLVEKEMQIFDRIMNRRDFLKTTSVMAATTLLNGCFRTNETPSQIVLDDTDIDDIERQSVTKASQITIDSDILDSYEHYAPLSAMGSSDATEIKAHGVMESFNPHLMTVDDTQASDLETFNPQKRNYGVVELVHLEKPSSNEDYQLNIYEKTYNSEQQAFLQQSIVLNDTASLSFDKIVAANGSFHNRISDGNAINQKMILLANIASLTTPYATLYYQQSQSVLLNAGVLLPENDAWESFDVIEEFKKYEQEFDFQTYSIIDIGSYEDGGNNNFIYGTLACDELYYYGFMIDFTGVNDTKPTIRFFTPQFLSKKSDTIATLQKDFDNLDIDTQGVELKDFALFSGQLFQPFVKLKESVLFTFLAYDTSIDPNGGSVYSSDGYTYDFTHFLDDASDMIKHYLVDVPTKDTGISYLLPQYDLQASLTVNESEFSCTLAFNTSQIPTVDLWSVYKASGVTPQMATLQFEHSFVRFVKEESSSLHILFTTSVLTADNIGVEHKSLKLDFTTDSNGYKEKFVLIESLGAQSFMDQSSFDDHDYKSLWFEDMKNSSEYVTIADCVNGDLGYYEFYATHNRQGVLKTYFTVKVGESRFLLNFNEQGLYPESSADHPYNTQSVDNLYEQIQQAAVAHFPPLPIGIDVNHVLQWRSVGSDEEVIFSGMRPYSINSEDKSLVANTDTSLGSYFYANLDAIEGGWNTHEINKQDSYDTTQHNIYKVTKHQLHLHTNNVYGYNANVADDVYIEVRFSSAMMITDQTDTQNPKTFHVNRGVSLFFKPIGGIVTLEVSRGFSRNDMFNGSTLFYRYANKEDFTVSKDAPVATKTGNSSDTSEFMQCNISFKQFERFSTEGADTLQFGMANDASLTDVKTLKTFMEDNVKSEYRDSIPKVLEAYTQIKEHTAPQNSLTPATLDVVSATDLGVINPLIYAPGIVSGDTIVGFSCCSSAVKWVHKAVSTVTHCVNHVVEAVKDVVQQVVDGVKKAVQTIVDKTNSAIDAIENLITDVTQSIQTVLASMGNILNNMFELAEKAYIFYISALWTLVRAFLAIGPGWNIGSEIKQLKYDQFSPDSTLSYNVYDIMKEQTANLEADIDTIATTLKGEIDGLIDSTLDISSSSYDTNKQEGSDLYKNRQENSTKHLHIVHQADRLNKRMQLDTPPSNEISKDSFVCDSGDNVEALISCIFTNELELLAKDIGQKVTDSEKLFSDIINGASFDSFKNDLGTLMKDSSHSLIDELDLFFKGTVQIPLAFFNGSTAVSFMEESLDPISGAIFAELGILLFGDPNRFKTFSDITFFLMGYDLFMTLGYFHDVAYLTGSTDEEDFITSLQNGNFRKSINELSERVNPLTTTLSSSDEDQDAADKELAELVRKGELIGEICGLIYHMGNFYGDKTELKYTKWYSLLLSGFLFGKMVGYVPVLLKHTHHTTEQDETFYNVVIFFADAFYYLTEILKITELWMPLEDKKMIGFTATIFQLLVPILKLWMIMVLPLNYFLSTSDEKNKLQRIKMSFEIAAYLTKVGETFIDEIVPEDDPSKELVSLVFFEGVGILEAVVFGITKGSSSDS